MKTLDKIKRIAIISFFLKIISPGFSYCEKCGLPWSFCNPKTVYYTNSRGTFATCDVCWDNSTLEELQRYYTIVYNHQKRSSIQSGYEMDHTLEHLLECVKEQYYKTHN